MNNKIWLLVAQGDGLGEPQTIENAYDNKDLANNALKAKLKSCCDLHYLQEVVVLSDNPNDSQDLEQ